MFHWTERNLHSQQEPFMWKGELHPFSETWTDIDGSEQDCCISSVSAMEITQCHTKLSIWKWLVPIAQQNGTCVPTRHTCYDFGITLRDFNRVMSFSILCGFAGFLFCLSRAARVVFSCWRISRIIPWNVSSTKCRRAADVSKNGHSHVPARDCPSSWVTWGEKRNVLKWGTGFQEEHSTLMNQICHPCRVQLPFDIFNSLRRNDAYMRR